jgi:hypothetical protein
MSDCQFCKNGKCLICQLQHGDEEGIASMLGRFAADESESLRYKRLKAGGYKYKTSS